jgi:chromosomal replication initiation ATPase DnaA
VQQLALDFPALARDPAAVHVETSCQSAARAALAAWREWPGGLLLLVGPEGGGKSHLAALWAREVGAVIVDGAQGDPPAGPFVLEDAERAVSERRLLAVIDAVRDGRSGPVLVTSRSAPGDGWTAALPDLGSRLALMPAVRIEDPTDEDLAAVFAKHLGDRGAEAPQTLVDYVVRRIERSFAAARKAAQILDRAALERKQRISRKLAAEVLGTDVLGAYVRGDGGREASDEAVQED